jgi:choline dehydrogenase-like flavoprotein
MLLLKPSTYNMSAAKLFRLRREDFQDLQHLDGRSPAWPIDYDTLAPYYDRAERLYHVHGQSGVVPTEPGRGPFPFAPIRL